MRPRFVYIVALTLTLISAPLYTIHGALADTASSPPRTATSFEKAEKRAHRAAKKKKWALAVRYGEQALEGLRAHGMQNTRRYIRALVNVNSYYEQMGRLPEIETQVKQTYEQALSVLGPNDVLTRTSRTVYYKQLVTHEDYQAASELVHGAIAALGTTVDDDYRRHRYLKHLYSLYGLTGELELEETALKQFLALDQRLYGNSMADNAKIIQNLANNYCRQGKLDEFENLQVLYGVKFFCPQGSGWQD